MKVPSDEILAHIRSSYKYDGYMGVVVRTKPARNNPVTNKPLGEWCKIMGFSICIARLVWLLSYNEYPSAIIDHINGNRNDNRLSNLRLATPGENAYNVRKTDRITSSSYKGVYWDKSCDRWIVRVAKDQKTVYVGRFITELDAAKAYDIAAQELQGKFACLNFGPNNARERLERARNKPIDRVSELEARVRELEIELENVRKVG